MRCFNKTSIYHINRVRIAKQHDLDVAYQLLFNMKTILLKKIAKKIDDWMRFDPIYDRQTHDRVNLILPILRTNQPSLPII